MRIGISKRGGGGATIITPNSSIVTWTGAQTWQAHTAMGNVAVVNEFFDPFGGFLSGSVVFNAHETPSSVAIGGTFIVTQSWLELNAATVGTDSTVNSSLSGLEVSGASTGATTYNATQASAFFTHTGTIDAVNGAYFNVFNLGAGNIVSAAGFYASVNVGGSGNVTSAYALKIVPISKTSTGNVTSAYGVFSDSSQISGAGVVSNLYVYYSKDQSGVAVNGYFMWYDSPGVYRINEAGIMAYYNPAFTKYVPAAANYERIVTQWNANVAEIGTEAGGTGTKRVTRILGTGVELQIYSRVAAVGVASLPAAAAGLIGARATVNDSNAASFTAGIGAIVAAGGATIVPVFCDGTNWRIG